MKIPESLFFVINRIVKILLRSPLHFFLSKSVMIITFTGRKSGRQFSTPIRYIKLEAKSEGAKSESTKSESTNRVRSFSADHGQWWRNLQEGADVELYIQGNSYLYHATVQEKNLDLTRKKLLHFLSSFPQDAVYHKIRFNKDKSLNTEDIETALGRAIVVEFELKNILSDA